LVAELPPTLAIIGIEPPGRGRRLRERGFDRVDALVDAVVPVLTAHVRAPWYVFGHSMGALLAFEIVRGLRNADVPEPEVLFASGRRAPHLPSRGLGLPLPAAATARSTLPDAPRDRAVESFAQDVELCRTYAYREEGPLDTRIVVLSGTGDAEITYPDLEAWRRHTTRAMKVALFDGDHFFVATQAPRVAALVGEEVAASRAAGCERRPT
jgi:medium-chain acyl-[acyl-carrier-protein] hydrolase